MLIALAEGMARLSGRTLASQSGLVLFPQLGMDLSSLLLCAQLHEHHSNESIT